MRTVQPEALAPGVLCLLSLCACTPAATRPPCSTVSDCLKGEVCIGGYCTAVGDGGAGCGSCPAGQGCVGGKCVATADAGSCVGITCATDEVCQAGQCVAKPCAANDTRPCGRCDTGTQVCAADHAWGTCDNETGCQPGEQRGCAGGLMKCLANCAWGSCAAPDGGAPLPPDAGQVVRPDAGSSGLCVKYPTAAFCTDFEESNPLGKVLQATAAGGTVALAIDRSVSPTHSLLATTTATQGSEATVVARTTASPKISVRVDAQMWVDAVGTSALSVLSIGTPTGAYSVTLSLIQGGAGGALCSALIDSGSGLATSTACGSFPLGAWVSLEVDVTFSQGLPLGTVVILESGKQVASAPFSSTGTPAGDTLLVNVGTFGAVATRVHYDDVVVIAN